MHTRELFEEYYPSVVVEANSFLVMERRSRLDLLRGLWPDSKDTCRGVLLDVTMVDAYSVLDILESLDLWLQPKTVVVFVGREGEEADVLFHSTLRNTHHTLFLALDDTTLRHLESPRCYLPVCKPELDWQKSAQAYWRCFYCNTGDQGIKRGGRWNLERDLPQSVQLFQDQTRNFMGHTFTVSGLSFFPMTEYIPESNQGGTTITLTDCIDKRILTAISSALNFTYIVREPLDCVWGLDQDGNWTGIVGDLQHNRADFSLIVGLIDSRAKVMDFSDWYIYDRYALISLKLQPLARYLSFVKPFTGVMWIAVFLSTVVLGFALWLITRPWTSISGDQGLSISTSFFYTCEVLVSGPSLNLPVNFTTRLVALCLWIFSFIVTSAYKSSLIAHLTIPVFPPPINSFQDLLDSDGVTWGSDVLEGAPFMYFNCSLDPVVREFQSRSESIFNSISPSNNCVPMLIRYTYNVYNIQD
ncbi:probable glutamate receptor [Macrobrachium nipponense]|uniref:probable glutamate receptor n=1 Tax=Macrobrachium nipponense TaxID=159736 RepID=UPI0030C8948D